MVEMNIPYIGLSNEQINENDEIILTYKQVIENKISLSTKDLEEIKKANYFPVEVDWYEECGSCGSDYERDVDGNILN
jgi:hypothetical protein